MNYLIFRKIYRTSQIANRGTKQYSDCKIGTKRYSDVFKPFGSSTKEAPGNNQAIVDLKDIQSILLREKNLKSSKIENSELSRHLLSKWQSVLFLQLHPNFSWLGCKIYLLWEDIRDPIFFMQQELILTVFLLNNLCKRLRLGK